MGVNEHIGAGKMPGETTIKAERRRSPRVPVPGAEVYFSAPFLPFMMMRAPKGEKCLLVDISAGGLQFITSQYLMPGKKLALLAVVPAFLGHLAFRARVVWSQKIPDKKVYRTGVEFLRMDRATRTKLENLRKDISLRSAPRKRPPGQA